MFRFAIGISLIILSLFIGLNQYFDNKSKIKGAENRFERTQKNVKEMGQFSQRLERAKTFAMKKGDDQPSRLESKFGLRDMGLELLFTSNPRPEAMNNQPFYKYEFHISGQASFFEAFNLLNTLEQTPGITLNYICVGCQNIRAEDVEEGREPVSIRGILNVYNPERM